MSRAYTSENAFLRRCTSVPCRIRHDNGADAGWTVRTYLTAEQAAEYVQRAAAWEHMPCWSRLVVVDGALHEPVAVAPVWAVRQMADPDAYMWVRR